MAYKITLQDLYDLIDKYGETSPEVRKYFEIDETRSGPFSPAVRLRADLVDVPGHDDAIASGRPEDIAVGNALLLNLANGISKEARQRRYYKMLALQPDMPRMVVEGDSWAEFPILLEDLIDNLMRTYNIFSLAEAGDTLSNMLKQEEYVAAIERVAPVGFIISAGGNDVVGDIPTRNEDGSYDIKKSSLCYHLKDYTAGATAQNLFKDTYDTSVIATLKANYQRLIDRVQQLGGPNMKVFLHGYDYATPGAGNHWLTGNLVPRGIVDPSLQWGVIKLAMDKFNLMLADLAAQRQNVHYVDLRGSVADPSQPITSAREFWHDELHPKNPGFASAADRIHAVMAGLIQ